MKNLTLENSKIISADIIDTKTFTTADLAQKVAYGGFTDNGNYTVIDFALAGEAGGCDYNSASISVYENFVVDSYDALANKVFAHDHSPSVLSVIDYDADYARFIVDKEGKAVDPAALTKYDVLTMKIAPYDWYTASDINSIEAVLVRDFVEGEIIEVNELEGKYYIGNEIYEIDPTSILYLQLGDKGKFYLDAFGRLAAFDRASQKSGNYGVIVDKNANNGMYEYYQIRMFNSEGNLKAETFALKVKVHRYDSYSGATYTQVYRDYEVYDMIGDTFPVVCSYRLNGDEEISDISIATENGVNVTENSSKSSAIVQNNTTGSGKIKVDKVATKVDVGRQYNIDNNTKIIAMESTADTTNLSVDNFALYTASDFSADQTFDKVSVYDVDENNCASLIFIYDEDITLLDGTGGGDPRRYH